ncbi:uncharacterized protein LOC124929804 [Impatiens glandulifera]|uniref:uncharacterized protein LOC124929804 n=1 Tax=Impatiens glandulifera TaxID=253017 RepID=UPI001FB127FC|nr:uncharacterized protein LOC124929804 [Impatiens glandulifera]
MTTGRNEHCRRGHQLNYKTNSFICDGCQERGYGSHYRCEICNFDLHKECHLPSLTILHDHQAGRGGGYNKFDFHHHPSLHRLFCDACGRPIHGFFYHCKDRGQDLHPCCANLPQKIHLPDTDMFLISTIINNVAAGSSTCFHCKKTTLWENNHGVPGWSYVSHCGLHWCHVYCLMKIMERQMRHRRSLESSRTRTTTGTGESSWWDILSNSSITLIQLITTGTADPTSTLIDIITAGG